MNSLITLRDALLAALGILASFLGITQIILPLLSRSKRPDTVATTHHSKTSHITTKVHKLDPKLVPSTHNNRRLIIVGDVHGCVDELNDLLKHVSFKPSHDHLILAGDLINKGPASSAVLKLVRSLGASCVRGNHEDKILRARAALAEQVGEDTPLLEASRGSGEGSKADALAASLSKKEIEYIRSWPLILDIGELKGLGYGGAAVVHAGLVPGVPLVDQPSFDVMNMRAIKVHKAKKHHHKDGEDMKRKVEYEPREDRDEGEKWHEVWNTYQEKERRSERCLCVYGHDSKQGLVERDYSVGLDSGCVKGGRLSALVVEGRSMRVESVRARRDHTVIEMGEV